MRTIILVLAGLLAAGCAAADNAEIAAAGGPDGSRENPRPSVIEAPAEVDPVPVPHPGQGSTPLAPRQGAIGAKLSSSRSN